MLPLTLLKELIAINKVKHFKKTIFQIYEGIGIFSMGLLTACVIFSVIARYVFSLSWKELSEFTITLFSFTTFWGMGICVLKDEHIVVDVLYNVIKPSVKRWVSVFDNLIVLIIDIVFFVYSLNYVEQVGNQISLGMGIPMRYMYSIMPVGTFICAICVIIKIVETITAPARSFESRNKESIN